MPLSALLATFTNNLLPILLISGVGFLLGKLLTLEPRTLSRVVFYFFSPVLVFNLLVHSSLQPDQTALTVAFSAAVTGTLAALSFVLGKLLKLERSLLLAVMISAAFGNTGNYGLPLVQFAFGEQALAYATIFFITNSTLFNSVGVLMASLGRMSLKEAALGLLRVPSMYTIPLAVLVNVLHLHIPLPLSRTIDLTANASIPLMLILLGLELTRVKWSHSIKAMSLGVSLRLVAGPLLGLLLAALFGLHGVARQANLAQTGVPAAVTTTVVASEYNLEPELVTAMVFVGTVLSPLTLTPFLFWLGR